MKKGIIILVVVLIVGVILTIVISSYMKRKTLETQGSVNAANLAASSQASLQNTQAMEACKKNWLCALSTTLGGLGNIASGISLV